MPGPYTRVAHGDRANDGSATDAAALVNKHSVGLERLEYGVIDVADYDADPTGSTDTRAALNNAIAAFNAYPAPAVLVLNGNSYKVNGTLDPITRVGGRVIGRGGKGRWTNMEGGTRILQTSKTAHTLTIGSTSTSPPYGGADLSIEGLIFWQSTFGGGSPPADVAASDLNPGSATLPSAGSAIHITGSNPYGSWTTNNVTIERCGFAGFYRHIDHHIGHEVLIDNCFFNCEVENAIRTGNYAWPDAGGMIVTRSMFQNYDTYAVPTSHVKWVSGGGLKLNTNTFVSGLVTSAGALSGEAKYAVEVDCQGANTTYGYNITTDIQILGNHIESHGRSGGAGVIVRVADEAPEVARLDRIIVNDNHIHTFQPEAGSHNGIEIKGSSLHRLQQVVALGNTLLGGASSTGHAVKLTNVDGYLVGNVQRGFASPLSATNCINPVTI